MAVILNPGICISFVSQIKSITFLSKGTKKLQISTSKILFFDVFCFRKKSDEENGYFSSFNNASEDDKT